MRTVLFFVCVTSLGFAGSPAPTASSAARPDCCTAGAACCVPGSPCCTDAGAACCAGGGDCRFPGAPGCSGAARCSQGRGRRRDGAGCAAVKADCCPGGACCPDGACCSGQ